MSDIMKLLEAVAIRLQAKTTQEAFMSVIKIKEIAEQQFQQAHKCGWEQCKFEAMTKSTGRSYDAIAAMEYKEQAND